jgi:uncharacterized protein (DUF2236 family)
MLLISPRSLRTFETAALARNPGVPERPVPTPAAAFRDLLSMACNARMFHAQKPPILSMK